MTVELVRTRTDDNVRLEGALFRPTAGSRGPRAWPADLVILVHGTGNNFYSPGILEHAAATVAAAGTPALRINTRGHDGLSGGRGGAALEQIDDCRLDLAAWWAWGRERDWERIVLVGHSMGGVVARLAIAEMDLSSRVAHLVTLGTPRHGIC